MESVVVRPARLEDLDALVGLYAELAEDQLGSRPASSVDAVRLFEQITTDPARHLLVASAPAVVVGTVDLLVVPNLTYRGRPWAIVTNLIVAAEARGTGVGRALLKQVLQLARSAGCYQVQLLSAKHRTGAHRFYRKLGFEALAEGFRIYFDT